MLNKRRVPVRQLLSVSALALCMGLGSTASGQQTEYSLEIYLGLQTQADTTYAAMDALDRRNPRRAHMATWALEDRIAQIDYLGDWRRSGQLDEAEMANTEAFHVELLLRDVVVLHTELGRCADARHNAAVLEHLGASQLDNPEITGAVDAAWASVGRCGEPHGALLSLDDPAGPASDARDSSAPTWIMIGSTLVILTGAYVAAVPLQRTNDEASTWLATHPDGATTDPAYVDIESRGDNQALLANSFMVVGAAGLLTGVAWYTLRDRESDQGGLAGIDVVPTRGGAYAQARWRW